MDMRLVERLKRKRIRSVRFDGRVLTVDLSGKRLRRKVSVGKHVKWCGSHGSQRVLVDDDFTLIEGFFVAVHETVEDHIIRILLRASFSRAEAEGFGHEITEEIEHDYARRMELRWKSYSQKVERVFRKEQAYAGNI
jgi:hypothetical protein